jgi:hypothetical protein
MRLTLRTLLSYLDDVLPPTEIKQIGQKVAESDAAQELIARIKQVTRRRRLTTPPATGPNFFDPNVVADYLDNELNAEQVAEVEKACLESDVHLAEIAACHQILTLVLGEPALVPPTARQRMYGLVKGREAIPFRKAAAAIGAGIADTDGLDSDADETLLLGLPFYRRGGSWVRWALPLAAVLLLVTLGIALWQALPTKKEVADKGAGPAKPENRKEVGGTNVGNQGTPEAGKGGGAAQETTKPGSGTPANTDTGTANAGGSKTGDSGKTTTPQGGSDSTGNTGTAGGAGPGTPPVNAANPNQPSMERREVGTYLGEPSPSVLVRHLKDRDRWERLPPGGRIATGERLVSLPGYASTLRLNSGAHVLLRGSLPQFALNPHMVHLSAAAVTLHYNPDFDLDLTLDRGRIFLSNHKSPDKGPARIRLRISQEIWDLTLTEPDTEVGVELVRLYTPQIDYQSGEEPLAQAFLCMLRGKAVLRENNYHEFPNLEAPPGAALIAWNNKGRGIGGPFRLEKPVPAWGKTPPAFEEAKEMEAALRELSKRMSGQSPEAIIHEFVASQVPSQRLLGITCLSAIDDVPKLIDVLDKDADPGHVKERQEAIVGLRRWIGRGTEYTRKLYDKATNTGFLKDKGFSPGEAQIVLDLLHDFSPAKARQPETYELLAVYLLRDKQAIRQLADFQLRGNLLAGTGVKMPAFDPVTGGEDQRQAASLAWKDLIAKGQVPPPLPSGGPGGPGGGAAPGTKPNR